MLNPSHNVGPATGPNLVLTPGLLDRGRPPLSGETLHFPVEIRRALGMGDEPVMLYFFVEKDRVVIVLERDFPAYLSDYTKRHGS